jgi:uncharacterized protein YcbK (DUF882 family)
VAEVLRDLTREDILKGQVCPKDYEGNLEKLLKRTNKLQVLYGKQFKVTSGLRSLAYHIGIYHKKGIKDPKKIPMKSKHLFCQAVDIEDKDGKLYAWAQKNEKHLEDIGLWYELGTRGWLHLQIVAPLSGKRGFLP